MSNAAHTEEIAARWLLRREEADWSGEDQAEFDSWLDATVENKVAYWRLEHGWQKADRLAALHPPSPAPLYGPLRLWHSLRLWHIATVAVPLAACLILSVLAVSRADLTPRKTYVTEIGAREVVPLADGTQIELNTGTTLRATVKGGVREVWLDQGEVYFEVVHDTSRPFVIHAGSRTLIDLGTKFSVRRNGDRVEVAVVSGQVQLENGPAARPSKPVILTGGDTATLRETSTSMAHNSIDKVNDLLSWRQGLLVFDQSTLADAASEFNRYSRRKLVITDPTIARMRISGRFESSGAQAFARLLRQAYGLNVADEGAVIKISG
jgi:transmembrane sensor